MTVVIMIQEEDKIYLASDMNVLNNEGDGDHLSSSSFKKIFTMGPMTIGACGSVRLLQLIKHSITYSDDYDESSTEHLLWRFTEDLFALLSVRTLDRIDNLDGELLVVVNGEAFHILIPDLSVVQIDTPYFVIGCGEDFALGSLYSTNKGRMKPKRRIEEAMAASSFNDFRIGSKADIWEVDINGKA